MQSSKTARNLWEQFTHTGKIGAYLAYRAIQTQPGDARGDHS